MIVADISSIENIVKKNEIGNIIKKLVVYLERNFSNVPASIAIKSANIFL
jgi:hypothetical protein